MSGLDKLILGGIRRGLSPLVPLFRKAVWTNQATYYTYKKLRHGHQVPAAEDYDIWVEGYPRCANTFCQEILEIGFPELRNVSHLHAPFSAMRGDGEGKPGVLVIREPAAAVVSYAIMTGHGLFNCLDYYIAYYGRILDYFDESKQLFVSDFAETTKNPAKLLQNFANYSGFAQSKSSIALTNEELSAMAFKHIDERYAMTNSPGNQESLHERAVARPNEARNELSRTLKKELQGNNRYQQGLAKAEHFYQATLHRRSNKV